MFLKLKEVIKPDKTTSKQNLFIMKIEAVTKMFLTIKFKKVLHSYFFNDFQTKKIEIVKLFYYYS